MCWGLRDFLFVFCPPQHGNRDAILGGIGLEHPKIFGSYAARSRPPPLTHLRKKSTDHGGLLFRRIELQHERRPVWCPPFRLVRIWPQSTYNGQSVTRSQRMHVQRSVGRVQIEEVFYL